MQIIVHRVNEVKKLISIAPSLGVELDIRAEGNELILNHEPFSDGDKLDSYLAEYNHSMAVFNIKEAGIEKRVIDMAKKYGVKDYFLLDAEFPYIYKASRSGVHKIAIRYSEDESIETVLKYKGIVDWVWIDTNTQLPLNQQVVKQLEGFKTCLVCPERWERPQDIAYYIEQMNELNFKPNAVMTAEKYINNWQRWS